MKYTPELINGVFTVNDSGKKVKFTKGNLYWNGSVFRCEDTQYSYPTTREASHIGHFFYSKDVSVAYAASYNDSGASTSDKFFAADGGAIEGFTVLSKDEWQFLLSHAQVVNAPITKAGVGGYRYVVEINSVDCVVLMPDGYKGTVEASYTADEWATAEMSGLVALPCAGYYNGSSFSSAGSEGHLWSSTPSSDDAGYASDVIFSSTHAQMHNDLRDSGFSVRLVSVQ